MSTNDKSDDYTPTMTSEESKIRLSMTDAITITGKIEFDNASYTRAWRNAKARRRRQAKCDRLWGPCGVRRESEHRIVIIHDDSAIAPQNRFSLPGGRDLVIAIDSPCFKYDHKKKRYVVLDL